MIEFFVIFCFFVLTVFSLYTFIMSTKNNILTLVLVVLIIFCGIVGVKALEYYRGLPIIELPENKIQIVGSVISNPYINLLIKQENNHEIRFYQIPYSEELAERFNSLNKLLEQNRVILGEFRHVNGEVKFYIRNAQTVRKDSK